MTLNITPKTSRDLPGQKPRIDGEPDTQEAIIAEADGIEDKDRDLVHGEGGRIDLPTRPGDLSQNDYAAPQAARRVRHRVFDHAVPELTSRRAR